MQIDPIIDRPWRELSFIGFDTETSGRYPISAEVCELAAVKWQEGQVTSSFQTLLKPSRAMNPEAIAIHGISDEMVADAPAMAEKIHEFLAFIDGSILIAHHAPFDLGFLACDIEQAGLELPSLPVICSSLLSRRVFPESGNHRLQTLIDYMDLDRGTAHRALDDARACLQVGIKCMERMGEVTLSAVLKRQGGPLYWERFSIKAVLQSACGPILIEAIRKSWRVEMSYEGGSRKGEARVVQPTGMVRNPEGDYLVAYCETEQKIKRYFLNKVTAVTPLI